MIRFESPDLDRLLRDLSDAPARLELHAEAVVVRAGSRIEDRARTLIETQLAAAPGNYLPHYPAAISSEVVRRGPVTEVAVGPESGRPQGGMGPGVEFGSARHAPMPHNVPALEGEVPAVERDLGVAAVRVLR